MQIINRKQEYDLLTSNEKIIHFGMTGKPVNELHPGHLHIIDECKRLEPEAKILLKIYKNGDMWRDEINGGGLSYPKENDISGIIDWASDKADYFLPVTLDEIRHIKPWLKRITTWYLPTHNLDIDLNWDNAVKEADNIMIKEGWNNIKDKLQRGMIYTFLISVVLKTLNYPIRVGGAKDLIINSSKKIIYEKYGHRKYYLIETVYNKNNKPF